MGRQALFRDQAADPPAPTQSHGSSSREHRQGLRASPCSAAPTLKTKEQVRGVNTPAGQQRRTGAVSGSRSPGRSQCDIVILAQEPQNSLTGSRSLQHPHPQAPGSSKLWPQPPGKARRARSGPAPVSAAWVPAYCQYGAQVLGHEEGRRASQAAVVVRSCRRAGPRSGSDGLQAEAGGLSSATGGCGGRGTVGLTQALPRVCWDLETRVHVKPLHTALAWPSHWCPNGLVGMAP